MTPHHTLETKKGFNLIEVAIVLGVVGMALGGVWLAAATVRENQQIASVSRTVLSGVERIRELHKGQALPASYTDISNRINQLNLYCDRINANFCDVPWNAYTPKMSIGIAEPYILYYIPIPNKAMCIKLTRAVLSVDSVAIKTILIIQDTAYNNLYNNTPTSASDAYNQAQTFCPESGKVGFKFEK